MVDVGTRKLLYQTSGGWSLVPTTASPSSLFRCSFDICGSCLSVSAEVGFHFGGDVSSSFSLPLLRKSSMLPKLGTRVCEFHVFFLCEGDSDPLHVLRKEFFASSATSSRVKTLRAAVMEARELLRAILGMSRFAPNPKAVNILRQGGGSWRMRQF